VRVGKGSLIAKCIHIGSNSFLLVLADENGDSTITTFRPVTIHTIYSTYLTLETVKNSSSELGVKNYDEFSHYTKPFHHFKRLAIGHFAPKNEIDEVRGHLAKFCGLWKVRKE
jgi:hypothetical protein